MPERLKAILDKITAWWKKFNTKQRSVLISIVAVVIVALKAGATATTGTAAAVSVKASDAAFGTPAGSSANADVINHTHEILKLYKSGKSNVEIAKLLSLGTGEVKLIIDLYKEGK